MAVAVGVDVLVGVAVRVGVDALVAVAVAVAVVVGVGVDVGAIARSICGTASKQILHQGVSQYESVIKMQFGSAS